MLVKHVDDEEFEDEGEDDEIITDEERKFNYEATLDRERRESAERARTYAVIATDESDTDFYCIELECRNCDMTGRFAIPIGIKWNTCYCPNCKCRDFEKTS